MWRYPGVNRNQPLPVRGRYRTDDKDGMLQAALNGLGVMHIATWVACDHLRSGELVALFPEEMEGAPAAGLPAWRRLLEQEGMGDLTVPLARVIAHHQAKLPRLFKRYQIQPVWRADRPGRGRFREFYQCDVDAIGSTSMTVEVELLQTVTAAHDANRIPPIDVGLNGVAVIKNTEAAGAVFEGDLFQVQLHAVANVDGRLPLAVAALGIFGRKARP